MSIGTFCSRVVATAAPGESIEEGARRMRDYGVGTLVVVGEKGSPEGIFTDRDVMVRCVGEALDPAATPVSEIMTTPVRTAHESAPLDEALESMRAGGFRRMVVTGDDGELVGILALDDVLVVLLETANRIGGILEKQSREVLAGR